MEYPGENNSYTGRYSQNSNYRGSYRGKSYRGGRGGYNPNSYHGSYRYPESTDTYQNGGYSHGNYRGDYYGNHRGGYYNASRPVSHNSYTGRYPKAHSQGNYDNRYHNQPERSSEVPVSAPSMNSPVITRTINPKDSPFLYLTELDKSVDSEKDLTQIREIFHDSDIIDVKLEEQKLQIWKNELELGLLSTQSEKDALSVQLTQEKLDALLLMD